MCRVSGFQSLSREPISADTGFRIEGLRFLMIKKFRGNRMEGLFFFFFLATFFFGCSRLELPRISTKNQVFT